MMDYSNINIGFSPIMLLTTNKLNKAILDKASINDESNNEEKENVAVNKNDENIDYVSDCSMKI